MYPPKAQLPRRKVEALLRKFGQDVKVAGAPGDPPGVFWMWRFGRGIHGSTAAWRITPYNRIQKETCSVTSKELNKCSLNIWFGQIVQHKSGKKDWPQSLFMNRTDRIKWS